MEEAPVALILFQWMKRIERVSFIDSISAIYSAPVSVIAFLLRFK